MPSLFEAFYETDKPAQLVLEHQSGSKPEQIYLRVFVENSKWHAFARISIRRLYDARQSFVSTSSMSVPSVRTLISTLSSPSRARLSRRVRMASAISTSPSRTKA